MRKFDPPLLTFTENRFMVCTVKEGSHMYQGKRGNFETKNLALIPSGVSSLSLSLSLGLYYPADLSKASNSRSRIFPFTVISSLITLVICSSEYRKEK